MSATDAPSFCACFTLEFMNTEQRVPRSVGFFAKSASFAKSSTLKFRELANVSMKEPQPEEQASFNWTLSTVPFLMRMHFISWPPISRMQSTSGSKNAAA